jgi:oligopeptide/dipeptide ABC transporter ATP-binding protein
MNPNSKGKTASKKEVGVTVNLQPNTNEMKNNIVLEVKGLKTRFHFKHGALRAIDDVSYSLRMGKTLGLVGESGSGKSVSALSIMRLLESPPAKIHGGQILFEDKDLLKISEKQMRRIRGKLISMIFQEPMTSLNPLMTVGYQISESLIQHTNISKKHALEKCCDLLSQVGIPSPKQRIFDYPHQLSGGMRQRVMIAIALACKAKVLIADEPTTALDVTIQAQILDLMRQLQQDLNTSILLITHDMGVIAEVAERVAVMYAGTIVEEAPVSSLFKNSLHPYTRGLLQSIPRIDTRGVKARLNEIPGVVPSLFEAPKRCLFYDRCKDRLKKCQFELPQLHAVGVDHMVRCWRTQNG